ncbi:hypothetical protein BJX96DRAFT_139533 [Aspergillus floccosus]
MHLDIIIPGKALDRPSKGGMHSFCWKEKIHYTMMPESIGWYRCDRRRSLSPSPRMYMETLALLVATFSRLISLKKPGRSIILRPRMTTVVPPPLRDYIGELVSIVEDKGNCPRYSLVLVLNYTVRRLHTTTSAKASISSSSSTRHGSNLKFTANKPAMSVSYGSGRTDGSSGAGPAIKRFPLSLSSIREDGSS